MKKKFNKKIFLKEIKEIRNPPLNVTSTDSYLFEHEYQINQPALYIYELTSVSILNHFIYSSETKEILNLNFQQPGKNQIFTYFPELINLEKYSLDKKINLLKNLILKKFNLVLKVIFIYLINDFIYKIRRLIVLLKSYLANGIDLDNVPINIDMPEGFNFNNHNGIHMESQHDSQRQSYNCNCNAYS